MPMLNTLFAVLLGIAALVGLVAAARAWGQGAARRRRATGWLVFAAAAALQAANLMLGYQWWISAVTALGLFVGLWMGLGRSRLS